ncbi:MAG TPA: hypothetical protein VFD70_14805 [Anaerolineae bacterium]|nr:hypothetical protein [Anaerolineae bacterium]
MKRTRELFSACLIIALVALIGCSADTSPRITDAALGTQVQAGKIVTRATTFAPQDRMIHLVVQMENLVIPARLGAQWYRIAVGGGQDQLLFQSDLSLDPLNTSADFTLTNSNDWQPGNYKVVITLNDKEDRTLNFAIKE